MHYSMILINLKSYFINCLILVSTKKFYLKNFVIIIQIVNFNLEVFDFILLNVYFFVNPILDSYSNKSSEPNFFILVIV